MSNAEAKVRVRLDTGQAQRDLSGLVKEAGGAAKAIGRGIGSALGAGVRAAGIGVGFGAGMEAIRGPLSSGVGEVASEAFGGLGAQIQHWALGDLVPDARASSKAREETIAAFSTIAGHTGKMPPEARSFYAQTKALMLETEKGRSMFERDEQFRGPGFEQIIARVSEAMAQLLKDAVNALADRLTGFFSW